MAAKQNDTKNPTTMADVEFINKVSVKAICGGKIRRPTEDAPGPTALCSVYGMLRGVRRGESDKGPWLGFIGDFEGVDHLTGKRVRGSQLFLPKAAESILLSTYESNATVEKSTGVLSSQSVAFALEIGIKFVDNQFGYEYIVKPIVKASEGDPLAELRGEVTPQLPENTRKLLAAPAK